MLTAVRLLSQQPIQRLTLDVFVSLPLTVLQDNNISHIAYNFLYILELTVFGIGIFCFGTKCFLYLTQSGFGEHSPDSKTLFRC